MSDNKDISKKEAAFALAALMEIPIQYRATQQLNFNMYDWIFYLPDCLLTNYKICPFLTVVFSKKESNVRRSSPIPPPREVIDKPVQVADTRGSSESVDINIPLEQVRIRYSMLLLVFKMLIPNRCLAMVDVWLWGRRYFALSKPFRPRKNLVLNKRGRKLYSLTALRSI